MYLRKCCWRRENRRVSDLAKSVVHPHPPTPSRWWRNDEVFCCFNLSLYIEIQLEFQVIRTMTLVGVYDNLVWLLMKTKVCFHLASVQIMPLPRGPRLARRRHSPDGNFYYNIFLTSSSMCKLDLKTENGERKKISHVCWHFPGVFDVVVVIENVRWLPKEPFSHIHLDAALIWKVLNLQSGIASSRLIIISICFLRHWLFFGG